MTNAVGAMMQPAMTPVATRRPIFFARLWLLIATIFAAGCSRLSTNAASDSAATPTIAPRPPGASSPVHFTEVADAIGVRFVHYNGAAGRKYMPETMGGGVAILDYDHDGAPDILAMNGADWPENRVAGAAPHPPGLFRNDGRGHFVDVTRATGLDRVDLYGMAAAVGDFDNDGFSDLFLTALGPNRLLHNEPAPGGGRRFVDVTALAQVAGVPDDDGELAHKWSTAASWLDYDRDGKLDLFVLQYLQWSPSKDPLCAVQGVRGYCPPTHFEACQPTLYRNVGGPGRPRFVDVTAKMGLDKPGKGMGIAVHDVDRDGWPDILVTNDNWPNFLWKNEQGKRFVEIGAASGVATSSSGRARAGMGVDWADVFGDGRLCLLISNFTDESLALYKPDLSLPAGGAPLFTDMAPTQNLAPPSAPFVGFGVGWADIDLDGRPDLAVANGHVDDIVQKYAPSTTFAQPILLFHHDGARFSEVGASANVAAPMVGRGLVWADIDLDGDPDLIVSENAGALRVFRNDGPPPGTRKNHFVRLALTGTRSNRDALGAVVTLTAGGRTQTRELRSGAGYLSESERTLLFGLGERASIDRLEILWPSGARSRFAALAADRSYVASEGRSISLIAP